MKTGMNLLLWTTHLTPDQFPLLAKIKAAGYDGVEVPAFGGEESEYKAIGQELQRQGLGGTLVTVMTPDANPVSPDPAIRKAAAERLRWAIRRTAAIGGNILCGPLHSALGAFTGNAPTADERKHAADVIRSVADEAQAAGVTLAIEFLCRFETYVLNTARDTAAFVRQVNHPAVGILFDTFHANLEEKDPVGALREAMPHVVHFHCSENDRGTPGKGHVPWKDHFAVLKKAGYSGYCTIEAFGRAMPEIAAATRVWRDFFPSRDEVYVEGLRFMKETWNAA